MSFTGNTESNVSKSKVWTTAFGEEIPFEEIPHQHVSNILWFITLFKLTEYYGKELIDELTELLTKYGGEKLPFKPLPIPHEIKSLRFFNCLDVDGNIVHQGNIVGSVTHIENWEKI